MLDTEQERRLDDALNYLKIPHHVGHNLCFFCGKHWKWLSDNMPKQCLECGETYVQMGQFCKPDNIIENGDKKAIVFVDGGIHGKKKQKTKDKLQRQQCLLFGYKVFVIHNEQIDSATVSWLRMAAWTMWLATADDGLYDRIYKNERECVGLSVQ